MPWIKKLIAQHTCGNSFFDVFAGTGSVTMELLDMYETFYINDFLYSNEIIFHAFFSNAHFDKQKLHKYYIEFNHVYDRKYDDEYFSKNYGDRYFSFHDASIIGEIRQRIHLSNDLNKREKAILVASLLYSADNIANTVGHYDAYRKIPDIPNKFKFRLIHPVNTAGKKIIITRGDANKIAPTVNADVVFLDPPYNSRQYSRFYHVLEEIAEWNKPKLYGVAMKPQVENMSQYSRVKAPEAFEDLVNNLHAKYIVTTYNNTYEDAKSSSSRNKITHEQLLSSLNGVGKTETFKHKYKFFNTGNSKLSNHSETVFITKTY